MPLLLLVSIRITIPKMELFDSNQELIISKPQHKIKKHSSLNKEAILCIHCQRTSSNGIRCLGMCVADNDY